MVSQILYMCVNKIPIPAVEETVTEIKERIEAKVDEILVEQGGKRNLKLARGNLSEIFVRACMIGN